MINESAADVYLSEVKPIARQHVYLLYVFVLINHL